MQPLGYQSTSVDSLSSADGPSNRTTECQYGTEPLGVCQPSTGQLGEVVPLG